MTRPTLPVPGSEAAILAGCTCPVIDNAHGKGHKGGTLSPTTGQPMFVYTIGCPVHHPGPVDVR